MRFSASRSLFSSWLARLWGAALLIYIFLLLFSAFPADDGGEAPSFSQTPGYSDTAPQIGPMRVVPLAKSPMRSPATEAP